MYAVLLTADSIRSLNTRDSPFLLCAVHCPMSPSSALSNATWPTFCSSTSIDATCNATCTCSGNASYVPLGDPPTATCIKHDEHSGSWSVMYNGSCSCAKPWPKLLLFAAFPSELWLPTYSGPGANLTAVNEEANITCEKAPAAQWGMENTPCGAEGSVPPGTYQLQQVTPAGAQHYRWECSVKLNSTSNASIPVYTNGTGANATVSLKLFESISTVLCVALYKPPPSCANTGTNGTATTPFQCPRGWTIKPNPGNIRVLSNTTCCVSSHAVGWLYNPHTLVRFLTLSKKKTAALKQRAFWEQLACHGACDGRVLFMLFQLPYSMQF